MTRKSIATTALIALLLTAIAIFVSCCADGPEGRPDGGGPEDDSGTVCSCTSEAENYCVGNIAMLCLDGCNFTPEYCAESNDDDGYGWCDLGECHYHTYPVDTDTGTDDSGAGADGGV